MGDAQKTYAMFRGMDTEGVGHISGADAISTLLSFDERAKNTPEETLRFRLDEIASTAEEGKITFPIFLKMSEALDEIPNQTQNIGNSFLDMGDTLLQGPTAHEQSTDTTVDATAFELVNRAEWRGDLDTPSQLDNELAELREDQSPSRPPSSTPKANSTEGRGIFRRRLENAKKEVQKRDAQITRYATEAKEKDQKIALLENQIQLLDSTLQEKERFIGNLLAAQKNFVGADGAAQEGAATLMDEYAKLAEQHRNAQTEVMRLHRERIIGDNRPSSGSSRPSSGTNRPLSADARNLRRASVSSVASDSADAILMESEALLIERDQTISDLKAELNFEKDMVATLKKAVGVLNNDVAEMDKLKYEHERSVSDAESARESLEARDRELAEADRECNELSRQCARLEAEESSLRSQISEMARQLDVQRRENDETNARRLYLDNKVDELTDEVAHVESERTRSETRTRELEAQIRRFDSELTKSDAHCGTLDGELQAKSAALHAAETSIAELRAQLAHKSAAAESLQHFLAEIEQRHPGGNMAAEDFAAQQQQQEAMVEELGEALSETRSLLAQAQEEVRRLQQQRAHDAESHASALQHVKEKAELEVQNARLRFENGQSEVEALRSELTAARGRPGTVDRQGLEQKEAELNQMRLQNVQLTERLAAAQALLSAERRASATARPSSRTPPRPALAPVTYDLASGNSATWAELVTERRRVYELEVALDEAEGECDMLKAYIRKQAERLIQLELRGGQSDTTNDEEHKSLVRIVDGVVATTLGRTQQVGSAQTPPQSPSQPVGRLSARKARATPPGDSTQPSQVPEQLIGGWPVVIVDNDDSRRHKLANVQAWFAVRTRSIQVIDKTQLQLLAAWSFDQVKQYGKDETKLALNVSGRIGGLIVLHSGPVAVDEMFDALDYASERND